MEIINANQIIGSYKIVNTEQLARGTGARYLECTKAHIPDVLIALQWRRKLPEKFDVIIDYQNNGGKQ